MITNMFLFIENFWLKLFVRKKSSILHSLNVCSFCGAEILDSLKSTWGPYRPPNITPLLQMSVYVCDYLKSHR